MTAEMDALLFLPEHDVTVPCRIVTDSNGDDFAVYAEPDSGRFLTMSFIRQNRDGVWSPTDPTEPATEPAELPEVPPAWESSHGF